MVLLSFMNYKIVKATKVVVTKYTITMTNNTEANTETSHCVLLSSINNVTIFTSPRKMAFMFHPWSTIKSPKPIFSIHSAKYSNFAFRLIIFNK